MVELLKVKEDQKLDNYRLYENITVLYYIMMIEHLNIFVALFFLILNFIFTSLYYLRTVLNFIFLKITNKIFSK